MKPNKGFITVLMMVLISISLSTFSRAAFDTFSDVPNDSPFHESICWQLAAASIPFSTTKRCCFYLLTKLCYHKISKNLRLCDFEES